MTMPDRPLTDEDYMRRALELARQAFEANEVPIGAVLVERVTGRVLSEARNRTVELSDPTAHAEMLALRAGCLVRGAQRIPGCDLYVTLEPCPMCAAAASFARVDRVIYGAHDAKSGGLSGGPCLYGHAQLHHKPAVISGLLAAESTLLLQTFFQARRPQKRSIEDGTS